MLQDDQDPNNIIEAYTFNFTLPTRYQYCKIPGSNAAVPIMSLGEDMMNLSLSGSGGAHDPVAAAARQGKVPTLGEVKRSLKALIKNLIQATTQMDALPKRRFATFKLFYYENTPEDYEPPHFRAGDATKDKWFMSTHEKGEVPERCSVGSVQTGYHGVDVKVTSVSAYLPSGEDNNAPFSGIMTGNPFGAPPLTPAGEAAMRVQQIDIQRQDAIERRVVWDGDDGLLDAGLKPDECGKITSDSESYAHSCPGLSGARKTDGDNLVPVGVRDEEGNVVPITDTATSFPLEQIVEARYAGRSESVPLCIGELAKAGQQPGDDVSPTQELEDTQVIPTPTPMPKSGARRGQSDLGGVGSSLPPSDIEAASSQDVGIPESVDTQMIKDTIMQGALPDQEDNIETQPLPQSFHADNPVQSCITSGRSDVARDGDITMDQDGEGISEMECECGVQVEDCDTCSCNGGCGRWYHLWCMGYHSAQDHRIPSKFICFDCRVRADRNWDLIVVHDLYPRMMARFKDLAIQRRGIKVFETHGPRSLSAFAKLIGCDSTVAGQVFRRLESEGFIAQESREDDDSGFLETTVLTSKRKTRSKAAPKGKAGKNRKALQKPVYVFIQAIKNDEVYKDYFNHDPEVEKRLLGLSEMKPERKIRKKKNNAIIDAQNEHPKALLRAPDGRESSLIKAAGEEPGPRPILSGSQTQQESQDVNTDGRNGDFKRKTSGGSGASDNAPKRIKISLGPPVDLGD
ncbi:hypothetical protein BN946_scf185014.g84 [Trametes cinnabarina]|uniref:HORMA domain-containing protein n=1 Tax=Pycnoporus cinnabarinus TaxID=5643 RepID=A0A060SMZ7_PYCCI|nr:hypothetical protein BN946_scf185014.g84 [Trametes cinnabarina]